MRKKSEACNEEIAAECGKALWTRGKGDGGGRDGRGFGPQDGRPERRGRPAGRVEGGQLVLCPSALRADGEDEPAVWGGEPRQRFPAGLGEDNARRPEHAL